jgi:hypothetical protein
MDYIKELETLETFSLFTKLIQKKINSSLLSDEHLNSNEKTIIEKVSFIDKKILFECPKCGKICLANKDQKTFNCDCETIIQIDDELEKEIRYTINKDAYHQLKTTINQESEIDGNKIICQFNERQLDYSCHNDAIYIHCTPFPPDKIFGTFNCLNNAYLDHFIINWNSIIDFLKNRNCIIQDILQYRKENIDKQINWSKIDEWKFQNLVYELIDKENMFDSIIPGGKGPDQEKDGFGYKTIIVLSKPEKVEALIQCKYTSTNATFNKDDIRKYKDAAIEHGSNYLLFVTNGYLSGATVTSINKGAFIDEKFRGIDFWDNHKLIILLERHPEIRLKYFFNRK